jgi:alcohol dehydrogenase class IV
MLPAALRVNRPACEEKLARIGELIGGASFKSRADAAEAAIERINRLADGLAIPHRLSELGVRREQLPALVESSHGNSLNGNPRELTDGQLYDLLDQML